MIPKNGHDAIVNEHGKRKRSTQGREGQSEFCMLRDETTIGKGANLIALYIAWRYHEFYSQSESCSLQWAEFLLAYLQPREEKRRVRAQRTAPISQRDKLRRRTSRTPILREE